MSVSQNQCIFMLFTLLFYCSSKAGTSAEPLTSLYHGYGLPSPSLTAGFISSPSIYSYTVTNNQNPLNTSQQKQLQQQQQVQPSYSNDVNNNNNNLINFSTNSNYQNSASISNTNAAASAAFNRNFYYTNNNNNNINTQDTSSSFFNKISPTYTGTSSAEQPAAALSNGCTLDRLAVYKVVLHTYWTRDLFPKHYPDWRPTAQWTKTLGRTHDASYALYHIGQQATQGVKQFTETGKSDILDSSLGEQQQLQQHQQYSKIAFPGNSFTPFVGGLNNNNNRNNGAAAAANDAAGSERSVFDEFNIPAILSGDGRSEAKFFVDSNHSFVSLMTRIVPSPDWFIGVDSFQLCVGGSWIDTVTVELDPLDAGTDNGFTFTAPNWPTSPQGVIYRITSRYPAHPAGSFFYPKSKRLPPIATFQFIKLKEYELSEVFNFAEDDRKYETVKTQTHLESEHNHVEMNNELSASIERERQNEISSASQQSSSVTERDRVRSQLLAKMNPSFNASSLSSSTLSSSTGVAVPKNDKNALMQNIANTYRRTSSNSFSSSSAGTLGASTSLPTSKRRRIKRPRDCRVSHWTEWTACSKTCGIGEMHRYRKVIKHGKRGGRPCPPLKESKWCGSAKDCQSPKSYFNWSNT